MLDNKSLKLRKYQSVFVIILGLTVGAVLPASARDLNAGFVLNKMGQKERFGYVSGVVEGLAYSRFLRDRPDETSMNCIYDWYYEGGKRVFNRIDQWLARHKDKQVGVLLYVLVKKECGA